MNKVHCRILGDHDEWLIARTSRIGGSDAASITGHNPYKSNTQLFDEKTGRAIAPDISDKPYVKFGVEAEPLMRQLFALDYPGMMVDYAENNFWTNDNYPWAHASLDGWLVDENGRNGVLEFKTTEILKPEQWKKWDDRIPDNYYVQILHYLMVTGFDFAILSARIRYKKDGEMMATIRRYRIERSEVLEDIDYLKTAEERFYKAMQEDKRPAAILPMI